MTSIFKQSLVVVFFVFFYSAHATNKLDSLNKTLELSKPDSTRVNALLNISIEYKRIKNDSSNFYADEALRLANKLGYKQGAAKAYAELANIFFDQLDYEQAIIYFDSSRTLFKELGDTESELDCIADQGSCYQHMGDGQMAFDLYKEAIVVAEENEFYATCGKLHYYIANNYGTYGKLDSAIYHIQIALKHFKTVNHIIGIAESYSRLGAYDYQKSNFKESFANFNISYDYADSINANQTRNYSLHGMAMIYYEIGQIEKALEMFTALADQHRANSNRLMLGQALYLMASINNELKQFNQAIILAEESIEIQKAVSLSGLPAVYQALGEAHFNNGSVELGIHYLNLAYAEANKQNNEFWMISSLSNNAKYELRRDNFQKSLMLLKEALHLLDGEIGSIKDYQRIQEDLSLTYSGLGDKEKAYKHLLIANRYQDSLYQRTKDNILINAAIEFDFERKQTAFLMKQQKLESENRELALQQTNKEKQIILGISLFLLCLLLGLWRISVNNRIKREAEMKLDSALLKAENERLRASTLENDLELKNKQLMSQALIMAENNEVLTQFKKQVNDSNYSSDDEKLRYLIKSLDRNLNINDNNWEKFKITFESIHTSFFSELIGKHPSLTPRELQLCALFRLNLSIKEVSNLLNLSTYTVKTARYRIRKKMDLNHSDVNFTNYLMRF